MRYTLSGNQLIPNTEAAEAAGKEPMATKSKKTKKAAPKPKAERAPAAHQYDWKGYSRASLYRLCGSEGFSMRKTRAVIEALGLENGNPGQIWNEWHAGTEGKNIPELEGDLSERFDKVAGRIEDDAAARTARRSGGKKAAKAKSGKGKAKAKRRTETDPEAELLAEQERARDTVADAVGAE